MLRLCNVRAKAKRNGQWEIVKQLSKQIAEFSHNGVRPEVSGPMVGHCGEWHKVQLPLPMMVPCCGSMMLEENECFQ